MRDAALGLGTERNNAALHKPVIAVPRDKAAEMEQRVMTAPNAARNNITTIASIHLANRGLLPLVNEESAPMPVIVSVRTVIVRSGIARH